MMHYDKALGPDGLNLTFYKFGIFVGWKSSRQELVGLKEVFFSTQLTDTTIVLIPKVENLSSMKDLRPILLCNAIYKIFAKVLANCIKEVLPKCISMEQSAFIEDHSILNNVQVVD